MAFTMTCAMAYARACPTAYARTCHGICHGICNDMPMHRPWPWHRFWHLELAWDVLNLLWPHHSWLFVGYTVYRYVPVLSGLLPSKSIPFPHKIGPFGSKMQPPRSCPVRSGPSQDPIRIKRVHSVPYRIRSRRSGPVRSVPVWSYPVQSGPNQLHRTRPFPSKHQPIWSVRSSPVRSIPVQVSGGSGRFRSTPQLLQSGLVRFVALAILVLRQICPKFPPRWAFRSSPRSFLWLLFFFILVFIFKLINGYRALSLGSRSIPNS